ncbi:ceramidase domain-containing protein [Photobacterium indicum]|uniref:Alkaline phytoceramidase n=1 Tax=Photobacterium indicum TaxID=81447 RepID=A0A2T3LE55_9GAMM|nr:ceramidase domain-containing protein [Photobacterium indicum]PSV49609.1 hypothetical protein C9J47_03305 [Photobacterium indicum]
MVKLSSYHKKVTGLIVIAAVLTLAAIIFSPIKQSGNFYDYADQRMFFSIPNFWNVISNLPFLYVGLKGLQLFRQRSVAIEPNIVLQYPFFFFAIMLTFFASSYYHLTPNDFTLMFDRIPITLAFIALYCIILTEFVSRDAGRWLFFPMIVYGFLSIVYWYITTLQNGRGDMSAYVLIQVIPIIHFPIILYFFCSRFTHRQYYLYALIAYVLSKWAESNDDEIYALLGGISGHSVKHVIAALGAYFIYIGFRERKKDDSNTQEKKVAVKKKDTQ